ncbi:hypothetical protein MHM39_06245 [Phaeobacter sp. CNT1-3]|jgi:hypothetical protein|nr:hypothetical protein [Thalassovita mediterranea]MCG7573161.1 hypothetical protein [Phaeobacter sp. CNT1-3]
MNGELVLAPSVATVLFVIAVLAGTRYRSVWKAEGPAWQLWVCGGIAGLCLLVLGFVPIAV